MLCSVLLFYIQYRTFIRESEEEGRNIFIVMFVPERSERNGKNDEKDRYEAYVRGVRDEILHLKSCRGILVTQTDVIE